MIFVDTNVLYNIPYETELTPKAGKAVDVLLEPVTSVIVYNGLIHVTFRAYAKRAYGIASYHDFRRLLAEREAFREPMESVHQLLEELYVRILEDSLTGRAGFKT